MIKLNYKEMLEANDLMILRTIGWVSILTKAHLLETFHQSTSE